MIDNELWGLACNSIFPDFCDLLPEGGSVQGLAPPGLSNRSARSRLGLPGQPFFFAGVSTLV